MLSAVVGFSPQPGLAESPTACAALTGLVPGGVDAIFLESYPTAKPGPLKNVGFLYDNAVAATALVGCGEKDSARKIGDAILAALDHDRYWSDGRLRNAYRAGFAAEFPVKLAGWWDDGQQKWLEDSYQVSSDTGNMAWAMLALLNLEKATGDLKYRAAALRIAAFVESLVDIRGAGGFLGGFQGWEPTPVGLRWKSTEHNTDLTAAFHLLAQATGESRWDRDSARAAGFVTGMWIKDDGAFSVGVGEDGVGQNTLLALDANLWPLLALPGLASMHGDAVFSTVEQKLRSRDGYAYSEAGAGGWTEGTAQMALLQKLMGKANDASRTARAIDAARTPDGGYFATLQTTLATGFADPSNPKVERYYLHMPHLAALAWSALAERSFNPFTASSSLP